MLTLEAYWMGRDKAYSLDLTEEVKANAQITLERVNKLLERAGFTGTAGVASGWRPRSLNARTPGASTTSKHITGQAVDVDDPFRLLADWCVDNLEILKELELWMEDPRWTSTWVHLQIVPPKSGKWVYIPNATPPLDPKYPVTWA